MLCASQADIIAFSYNRPMQLYAFLESMDYYASNVRQISVIYRCVDEKYCVAYQKVINAFPQVKFIEQKSPPDDFKPLLLAAFFNPDGSDYVAFAVDDDIAKDFFDFNECIEALENTKAYGFYLWLGVHVDVGIPAVTNMIQVGDKLYFWQFKNGKNDWGYPNSVDMVIYRKKEIELYLRNLSYNHPNSLESAWAAQANFEQIGLCYKTSKIVNIPLNLVNFSDTQNLNIPVGKLLIDFNSGSD